MTSSFTYSQLKHFPPGPVINLKAGYHFSENKSNGTSIAYDYSIPGGLTFEISGEMPTGKGWYLGLGYDYSLGNDAVKDISTGGLIKRDVYISNISAFVKKRVYMERSAIFFQLGFGKGTVTDEYASVYGKSEDGVISLTTKLGGEYVVAAQTIISLEAEYLGLGQFSMHGSSRGNSIFMIKAGIGFVFK
jgi:hypothetical protein